MSENGGNIRNTLTLEVGQFENSLKRAVGKLNDLDKKLDSTARASSELERSMNGLNSNIAGINSQFSAFGKSLSGVLANMGNYVQSSTQAARSSKKLADSTKQLNKETGKSVENVDRLADFSSRYNRKLDDLQKTTKQATEAQKKHTISTSDLAKMQDNAAARATKSSAKALRDTVANNEKTIKSHKESLAEINKLKREAEIKLAQARTELNKRYFGRNANSKTPQAEALRKNIAQAEAELKAISATQVKVADIVAGLTAQNQKLKAGTDLALRQNQAVEAQIALRQRLLYLKQKENDLTAKQLQMQRAQADASKNFVGPQPYSQLPYSQRQAYWAQQRQSYATSSMFVGPAAPTAQQIQAQRNARLGFVGPLPASMTPYGQQQAAMAQQRAAYGSSAQFMGPLPATSQQRQMQSYYQNSKNFVGPYPATHPNSVLSYGAQQAQAQALARQQTQNHNQQMQHLRQQQQQQAQMHKEQMSFAKELAMMYAAMRVNQSIFGAVHQNSNLEQAKFRLGLWNLSSAENERFIQKSRDLTKQEKYLTQTEAIDARLDAMAAMGGNHESTIDGTLSTATRVAHIVRATGNETGSNSDIVKNLYGFAEARQVMANQEEINKSFETLLKISEISNGKIKIADVETVARNMGSMRSDVSAEGWLQVAALAEQFKTAGGGNGGGGGVATVGNMLKMMGLYGSGRTITNRAVENLYGADLLNDFDGGDAEKSFKQNAKQIKEFTKMMKNAGFKDTKAMGENPVEFFAQMRGQILDSMMRKGNFEKFFGEGAKRWTYDNKGQMINSEGAVVDGDEQNKIEKAGMTRWAAQMGWSNRMVDGMVTMLDKRFIDRAREVAESGKRAADSKQALAEAQATLKGNVDNLMASLGRLAESFAPLLPLITSCVEALASMTNTIAGIMEMHPAIAIITGLGVAFGAAALTATVFFGKLSMLRTIFTATTVGLAAMSGGATVASGRILSIIGPATAASGSMVRLGASATAAGAATATAGSRILGVLGGIMKWVGWPALAGMMGWAIGTWLKDVEVGGITIGQRVENMLNDMVADFKTAFQEIRVNWNTLLSAIGSEKSKMVAEARAALADARSNISQIGNTRDQLHYRTDKDAKKSRAASLGSQLRQIQKSGKQGTIRVENKIYTINPGKNTQSLIDGLDKYARSGRGNIMPFTLPNAGSGDASRNLKNSLVDAVNQETLKSEGARVKANNERAKAAANPKAESKEPPKPKDTTMPTPSHLADYSASNPFKVPGSESEKPKRGDREWNNPFYASYQDLKNQTLKKVNLYDELGGPTDYEALAKSEFTTKWLKGDFDPDNDPRSRMFTKGDYNKETGWLENQINWDGKDATGISVRDWLDQDVKRRQTDDIAKGLRFAAERVGSSQEAVIDIFKDFATGTDQDSSAGEALKRQFARQEVRTPIVADNKSYQAYKRDAITNQSVIDYGAYATSTKKINEQLQIDLMDSEVDKRKATADLVYREEVKKIDAIRGLLDEQIKAYEEAGDTESNSYRAAVDAKMAMESTLTQRVALENKKRVQATETATQKILRQYGDLKANLEGVGASWTEKVTGGFKDLITGKLDFDEIDWRDLGSSLFGDLAGVMTEKVISDGMKTVLGEGDPFSNVMEMGKSLWGGYEASGGWLGKKLNEWRGIETTPVALEAGANIVDLAGDGNAAADIANSGTELTSMFGTMRDKLAPLTDGLSNLWSSVTEASSSLWTFASDAITKAISALHQWIVGLLASQAAETSSNWIGTAFQVGMAAYGAYSGGSGDMSTFSGVATETGYNYNTGGSGGYSAGMQFAKGGAFTNGLYDSPTPFMFANGGTFGNLGVMGEAGPEAVMPLTRDSSGRLGVSADGLGGGEINSVSNQVSIQINVSNDGSSSQSSQGDNSGQDWTRMANAVRAIVVEEIVSQSRPGGVNYKK